MQIDFNHWHMQSILWNPWLRPGNDNHMQAVGKTSFEKLYFTCTFICLNCLLAIPMDTNAIFLSPDL